MKHLLASAAMLVALSPGAVIAERVNGIDVSHYQGDIDWSAVAGAGVVFAYAKAAEGDTGGDSAFARNWQGMQAAGLLRGAYDFYVVGDDPETQAQDFISRVTLVAGDLPPMVDIETESRGAESDPALIADLHRYLEILSAQYGVAPIIYTSPGFWNAHFDDSFSDYPLWVAEYGVTAPKAVTGWSVWTIWQHAQDGAVAGISGAVDLDHFNGSLEQLRKFTVK